MDLAALYKAFVDCGSVSTDTRHLVDGSIFFALRGDRFNGNDYALEALERGCQYAVVDDKRFMHNGNKRLIYVKSTLQALQDLANYHRRRLDTRIIAVTGTNGKTTTKELIASALSARFDVLYTEGNLNNHIGVPLTLLRLAPEHELAVIEMGASHPGDIRQLCRIAEPDYGLITNLGRAHLEGFGSFEGVVKTKCELYDFLRYGGKHIVFVDRDNEVLEQKSKGLTRISYGITSSQGVYVQGADIDAHPFLKLTWKHDAETYELATQLIGDYNAKNVLAAITVGRFFSVPAQKINEAIAQYQPGNHRSEYKETGRNRLIIDAYNANPTSMRAALDNFAHLDASHKVAILGDMCELGEATRSEHLQVVEQLQNMQLEKVILVGGYFNEADHSFAHYPDADALVRALQAQPLHDCTVLLKGSNALHLDKLIPCL